MRLLLAVLAMTSLGAAQDVVPRPLPRPMKFHVNHADPYFIVAMLEGRLVVSPEMSTILGFVGIPPEAGQGLNRLFKGRFVVNAADNAIWFFPDPTP